MNATTNSRIVCNRALVALATAAFTVFGGAAALADDTDIVSGQVSNFAAPNILFIIDTSGSMDGDVLVDDSYDPAVVYTGPYTDNDRLYYVVTDFVGDYSVPDEDYAQFGTYVNRASFACDTGRLQMQSEGFYLDRYVQFNDTEGVYSWGSLGVFDNDPIVSTVDHYTECFADDGMHGFASASPDIYPADGDITIGPPLPWTADENDPDRYDWRTTATRYVFFENNYLNWVISSAQAGNPVISTRLEVVQNVSKNLINARLASGLSNPMESINVGLMRFSTTGEGGMVLQEVDNLSTSAVALTTAIDSMTPSNNTPLSETLYEAYLYFNGDAVDYGDDSQPQTSVATSISNGNYISPIEASCQKNYVVLLTDGLPTSDNGANENIGTVIGGECAGNCLDDLAQHMAITDNSTAQEDTQVIKTFTIGFFTESSLLENAATGVVEYDLNGDLLPTPLPGYFIANNTEQLEAAFNQIFQAITSDVETFTSPAVSVNSLNRLQNRNVLYFTMFSPSAQGQPHWDGNLKAYYLGRQGNVNQGANLPDVAILDADFNEAVGLDGSFKTSARSIWSTTSDGASVTDGGFAARLGIDRKVVTNVAGSALFAGDNRIDAQNTTITATQMGYAIPAGATPAEIEARRVELLNFASGLEPDGTARKIIGDPLHTQPLIVTFGDANGEDLMLFMTTNDGYLHAVDPTPTTDSGNSDLEEFAFIPKELLGQIEEQERNLPTLPGSNQKMYGLDGPLTAFIDGGASGDDDFIVEAGERLYVYASMRRGGKSYYGLDFGSGGQSDPTLAFQIDSGDTNFGNLGQTWSAATHAKINFGGATRDVLIFGGGYDVDQDTANNPDNEGNALFIVDAVSGDFVWSASDSGATLNLADMQYSVPSDVSVLDTNQDGLADRLYVGDMGAQVWRFDISDDGITGAKFADLGEAGAAGERRFFNRPSVARIVTDHDDFLTIAIGSGYRSDPLSTANQDRLYLLKDENVFLPPVDGQTGNVVYPVALTSADLASIDLQSQAEVDQLQSGGGWFLDLPQPGEKNLSSALIADNRVFFTTYSPGSSPLSCQPSAAVGNGRLYVLDILTGLPALDRTDASDPGFVDLDRTGIPPTPTLVFTEPPCIANCDADPDDEEPPVTATNNGTCIGAASEASMLVATQTLDVGICTAPSKTYWVETDRSADEL